MSDPKMAVTRLDLRHDRSACLAYASVMVRDMGIEVRGIRVLIRPDGSIFVQLPQQRTHEGTWFPAVRFSNIRLEEALKAAVVEAFERMTCGSPTPPHEPSIASAVLPGN